jgi:hypothetical protein
LAEQVGDKTAVARIIAMVERPHRKERWRPRPS